MDNPGRLQFSTRLLLSVVALVAVAVTTVSAQPTRESYVTLVYLALMFPTLSVIVAIRTQGVTRAFWLAAAVPLAAASVSCASAHILVNVTGGPQMSPQAWNLSANVALFWCLAPINGIIGALAYWFTSPPPPGGEAESQISR